MSRVRKETIVSLKAFGDLVIARSALSRIDTSCAGAPGLLIGSHLCALNEALGPYAGPCAVVPSAQVPAIFDMKKRGLIAAVRSALDLRFQIATLTTLDRSSLVFDRLGLRERWLAGERQARALPRAENIYAAFESYLVEAGWTPTARATKTRARGRVVAIFPSSRISAKNAPLEIVTACVASILSQNMQPSIVLLEGERLDVECSALRPLTIVLPHSFSALVAAVRATDIVISADSLPAHLGEFSGLPVFVATPRDNSYWLPRAAFAHDRWAKFDALTSSPSPLDAFLSECLHGA